MSDKPIFQPNDAPAGGWGALHATAKALREESAIVKGGRSLLSMNQPDGFDCPGCAWPDPKHTSSFEFCENGAKAVAWETTKKRVTRDFFARWTVGELERQTDHWLEDQGRLTEPMQYDPAAEKYVPISWDGAFALIGRELRALTDPNEASSIPRAERPTKRLSSTSCLRGFMVRTTFRIARTCAMSRPASVFPSRSASAKGQWCLRISITPTPSSSSDRTPEPTARA